MKKFSTMVIIFLAIFTSMVIMNEFEIFGIKFWGGESAGAKIEVFERSQSYVEGKRRELIKYHHEWSKSNAEDKLMIESTIRQSFSNFNPAYIQDSELYDFLDTILHK